MQDSFNNRELHFQDMTLHIFNPEHDLALASGLANFTAPHAGRQLRHDLGWLPALWADGLVLTDDAEQARRATLRRKLATTLFADKGQVASIAVDRIEPWGWDAALRSQLLRMGLSERLMPTEAEIDTLRHLSHRRTAASLLPRLQVDGQTVGEAHECTTTGEVEKAFMRHGSVVLKAPWSSSGRGVRFVATAEAMKQPQLQGWLRNTLERQQSVMVEPCYNKVKDFGLEFMSDGHGHVAYVGLSLFHTQNGFYTGNIIATETAKRQRLSRYATLPLVDDMAHRIETLTAQLMDGCYAGPFGVDMMVVRQQGITLLHPCVELNLRRTMGHVAIAMNSRLNPTADDEVRHVMRIESTEKQYKLRIKRL